MQASGRKVNRSLRQDILASKERERITFENYKRIPEYSRCKALKYVFITKKIDIAEEQRDLFRDSHLWYADEHMFEYYIDLYEKIGEYAIYNFLADFGVYPSQNEQLSVFAMSTTMGGLKVYSFYVHPKELLKFAYVARRRYLKEDFYQRMLDKSRINKISKFLDSGGIFPTNIILSIKEGEGDGNFKKIDCPIPMNDSEVGVLTFGPSYNACWIIDGQHRLYSFAKSKSNELVSCLAFNEIDISNERRFFLEINREQRPIQPDLIWDLEGLASPNSPRGIISNIVHTLNKDLEGPFIDKI